MKRSWNFLWWLIIGAGLLYLQFVVRWIVPFGSMNPTVKYDNDAFTPVVVQSGAVTAWNQFQKYNQIFDLLQETYYDADEMDLTAMQENALKWFVDALNDPYTVYLTPDENKMFDESMQWSQNFEGIGAVVTKKEDGVLFEVVLKWMPAFNAGIKPLDLILMIDDQPTDVLWLNEAVALIRGERGSSVTLTILRGDDERTIEEIVVVRDAISVPSVTVEVLEKEGKRLAYVEMSVFGDDTVSLFEKEIKSILPVDGVILDLRWNWWGYLPTAVEVASFFLPKNEVITTAKYSIFPEEKYRSLWFELFQETPTVVLIDELSASASEIVAAALQERWGIDLVVGEQSFGKWSIQTLHTNGDGSSLKYTIGKWYTPSDDTIDDVGVTPDVTVALDFESFIWSWVDTQLNTAQDQLISIINE